MRIIERWELDNSLITTKGQNVNCESSKTEKNFIKSHHSTMFEAIKKLITKLYQIQALLIRLGFG
jgi:hypothetical protein